MRYALFKDILFASFLFFISYLFVFIWAFSFCSSRLLLQTISGNKKEEKILCAGVVNGVVPFVMVNGQGNYEGIDIDIAQIISKELDKKLEIKEFSDIGMLLSAVQKNKVDCALSALDITPDRLKKIEMIPYLGRPESFLCLLFWEHIPKNIKTLSDFKLVKKPIICVELGSLSAQYLNQFNFIEPKLLLKFEDMLLDIKYGKSNAILAIPQTAWYFLRKNNKLRCVIIPLPEHFNLLGLGIACAKQSYLIPRITNIIKNLEENKTFWEGIEKKWYAK